MTDTHHQALPLQTRIAEFELVEVLGAGGFGITYKAIDHQFQREVAIKEYLPSDLAVRAQDRSTVVARSGNHEDNYQYGLKCFLDEARTLARFKHHNIVRVLRFLETNGTAYLVMAYEEGQTLTEYLVKHGPVLEQSRLQSIFVAVMDGLMAVHAQNFLHRDIKPGNIYIRSGGSPMLIDFGASRQALSEHSRTLTSVLTAGYAPIEQYSSKGRQGPWTDIYALGATMYRCVTGNAPPEASERMGAVGEDEPDPYLPALQVAPQGRYHPTILKLIDWMMKLRPHERPMTVEEVQAVFKQLDIAPAVSASTGRGARKTAAAGVQPMGPQVRAAIDSVTGSVVTGMHTMSAAIGQAVRAVPRAVWYGLSSVVVLLVLAGFGYQIYQSQQQKRIDADHQAFKTAKATGTTEALQAYETACKICSHKEESRRLRDDLQYAPAAAARTVDALKAYLGICEVCGHKDEAQQLIAQIEEEARLAAEEAERQRQRAEAIAKISSMRAVRRMVLTPTGYMPAACARHLRAELAKAGVQLVDASQPHEAILETRLSQPRFWRSFWAAGWLTNHSCQVRRWGDDKVLFICKKDNENGGTALKACTDAVENIADDIDDARD